MSAPDSGAARPARGRWGTLLPVAVFVALAVLFMAGLTGGDPSKLPSALLGKTVPEFDLAALAGIERDGGPVPGLKAADLKDGSVTLVNVWASWCGPCRDEHPQLMQLAATEGLRVAGINYKDEPANARRFLNSLGNPFSRIGADTTGRTAVDWGVYGVPESFLVDGKGTIVYKFTGPISPEAMAEVLMPRIREALAAAR